MPWKTVARLALLLLSVALTEALELHIKAGPNGRVAGDCPFAHAIRIAAAAKSIDLNILPHGPTNKPEWLVSKYDGKMPCLVSDDGKEVVTESKVIAQWLEDNYPTPPLTGSPLQQAAEEVAGPVFGAFARYCKSTEDDESPDGKERKKALLLALCNLDTYLQNNAAPFAAGPTITTVDCFLLPALYHIQVAGLEFKGFEIPYQFDALNLYMERHLNSKMVQACTPPEAMVLWGWANARGDTAAAYDAERALGGKRR